LETPQGLNDYCYAGNNPVNFDDPLGLYISVPSPADYAVCSRVKREHPELWNMKNDKFAHCALACQFTKEYGPWTAHNCAYWKEWIDKYDPDPKTHFDPEDYRASIEGIRVGLSGGDCTEGCKQSGGCP
jgi:hypothetical protein